MSGFHHTVRRQAVRSDLLAAVILAGAGLLAYSNTFWAPFVFDGVALQKQFRPLGWDGQPWLRPPPRTIGYLTFDLQYTLHGNWLPGFHAANLAIHVAASWLLYWIVDRTIRRSPVAIPLLGQAWPLALFAALIFELHPLQTQSVTYLYQRFESLMGMFFLASLACFMQVCGAANSWSRAAWSVAAWSCVMLSAATKEIGVVAPLVMLWYDRVFVSGSWRLLRKNRFQFFLPTVFLLCGAAVFLFLRRDHYIGGGIFKTESVSLLEYARTQPAVILHYLRLFFWPRGQCLDLVWAPADQWHEIWPPLMGLMGLFCLTGWAILNRPWLGFLFGSFFLILAPTSSFLPIVDLAFEHRMYLPIAPLAVAGVICASWALGSIPIRLQPATGKSALDAVFLSVAVVITVVLGVTTYNRNEIYRRPSLVWSDVLRTRPNNARALGNLAWCLDGEGADSQRVITMHRRALALKPNLAISHRGLASHLSRKAPEQALFHAREAMRLEPDNPVNFNNLGILLVESDPIEAERLFRESLRLAPNEEYVMHNLLRLLLQSQRTDEAIKLLQDQLRRHPDWQTTRQLLLGLEDQQNERTIPRRAAETAAPLSPAKP